LPQQRDHLAELLLPPDERRRLHGQRRLVEALQRGEPTLAELVDPLRRGQVLQPVLAEIEQLVRVDELARRLRDEHLPAVADGGDPSGAVDVEADVSLLGDTRLAGVDPHAHTDRSVAERVLGVVCGRQCIGRTREGDEERVPLGVDLDPAVPLERVAKRARRCSARASAYASPSSCSRRVDPSMSVKRKVTVPAGRSATSQSSADQAAGGSSSSS
jgi:hypothetical protein